MADHGFWNYAAKDPGALALVEPDGREWTRGELLASCNRIVHGLRALGLGKGDVVAAVSNETRVPSPEIAGLRALPFPSAPAAPAALLTRVVASLARSRT